MGGVAAAEEAIAVGIERGVEAGVGRLLAVEPDRRRGAVFAGLLGCVIEYGRSEGCDLAVISGIESQAKLYRHLGFKAFGPPIGTAAAPYRAMYVHWDSLAPSAKKLVEGAL